MRFEKAVWVEVRANMIMPMFVDMHDATRSDERGSVGEKKGVREGSLKARQKNGGIVCVLKIEPSQEDHQGSR